MHFRQCLDFSFLSFAAPLLEVDPKGVIPGEYVIQLEDDAECKELHALAKQIRCG